VNFLSMSASESRLSASETAETAAALHRRLRTEVELTEVCRVRTPRCADPRPAVVTSTSALDKSAVVRFVGQGQFETSGRIKTLTSSCAPLPPRLGHAPVQLRRS
jgi:hypothetical protein